MELFLYYPVINYGHISHFTFILLIFTRFWADIPYKRDNKFNRNTLKLNSLSPGAHQMEPPSPKQALGVNPFPSRFIIRTVPRGDFTRRRREAPITTTKWHCYCTSSNSRKFGVDRPNTIIFASETWLKRFHPSEIFFLFFLAVEYTVESFKLWLC